MRIVAAAAALAAGLLASGPGVAQETGWDGTWTGTWNNATPSTVVFSKGRVVSFTYGGAAQAGLKSTGDGYAVNVEGKGFVLTLARTDENGANASYRGPQGILVSVMRRQ